MKNKTTMFISILLSLLILCTSQVYAYSRVSDNNIGKTGDTGLYWIYGDENPQYLNDTDYMADQTWLASLLGFDSKDLIFIQEDTVTKDQNYTPPEVGWTYAVLKFANERTYDGLTYTPHLAIRYEGDDFDTFNTSYKVNFMDKIYSTTHLSSVVYFSITPAHESTTNNAAVPESSTMILLGTGLIGIGAVGRKRFRKE